MTASDRAALRKPVATPRLSHLCENPGQGADRSIADLFALIFIGMLATAVVGATILVGLRIYGALQPTLETFA